MEARKRVGEGGAEASGTEVAPDSAGAGSLVSDQRWFARVWHWLSEAGRTATEREARAAALAMASPQAVWQLLREMPVGLVLYDADFRIVYQNPAGETMTGYPNAQFAGQSPVGLWMPDQEPGRVEEHLARMREDRVALRGRSVHVKKDGSHAWVQWYTSPLFEGERFLGYLGVHTNLSEEVRIARHQAELLIDAATDIAILQLSPHGRVESWTRNAAALFGRDAREVLGSAVSALFAVEVPHGGFPPGLLAQSLAGERAEHEGWLLRQGGEAFWANVRLYPQRDDDGLIIGHAMLVRDLSERREAEEKIRAGEAQLANIVSGASDAIVGLDDAGRVHFANPAAERLFGPQAQALTIEPLKAWVAQLDTEGGAPLMTSLPAADGSERHLEVSATRTRSAKGRMLTLIARDVTERVASEQALARYRKQLSALTHDLMEAEQKTNRRLAQLLHDQLGQTFTSLRIFVDALRTRLPPGDDPSLRHAWSEVSTLIDRGMTEVREVLDDLRPVLLEEQGLAIALDNEAQTQAFAHPQVQTSFEADASLNAVRWPRDAEYAAFMVAREAIANALKHSGCAHLRIALRLAAGGFVLEVEDDGEGLAQDDQQPRAGHLGMVGMRERALGIGAILVVRSGETGHGTRIRLEYAA
ncbi:PAS domain S-box protein [Niveibacterium sp. SC-1]|uniref:PAS domain-containing sensor histidine kinase n=1 Tax=Niveibacterium sp. SC-1 TaxID=3135646 RepID=UPI00311FCB5E